jgi:hypothetical protein
MGFRFAQPFHYRHDVCCWPMLSKKSAAPSWNATIESSFDSIDPFRKQELAAIVHPMFGIFHRDMLIGRPELESGDPRMGVALGQFEPTDAIAPQEARA